MTNTVNLIDTVCNRSRLWNCQSNCEKQF